MKTLITGLFITLTSFSALAFQDATFTCKNKNGLPPDTYKFQGITMGSPGVTLPYVEVTRHFRLDVEDPNSQIIESHMKGFATLNSSNIKDEPHEALTLEQLSFGFDENNQLIGCDQ